MGTESAESVSASVERVCTELAKRVLAGTVDPENVEASKLELCRAYDADRVPKHTEVLDFAPDGRRSELASVLQRKPVRTASGVSPVAIMTSPEPCPHGKCLYCPGGPASEFSSAQSYTGHEPAAARGVQTDYDPYAQVTLRLEQLRKIGHPVEKIDLILMGGTMTARSHDYQEWFVKRALAAMNDYDPTGEPDPSVPAIEAATPDPPDFRYTEDVIATNETADVRCIGITFETKPDWCGSQQIDRMLRLGGTKVEVGVQTTYDDVNRAMHRGHGVQASISANRRLRDAGFKVGFHMMPGQPGMTREMCREDFRRLFDDPDWRPDHLKIYPTLVVRGTRVYDMWKCGEYEPLTNDDAAELVAEIKASLPRYVRLQRVQRDIPANFIDAGVWKSNLRQLARARLEDRGETCDCIRCREVGHHDTDPDPDAIELDVLTYESAGGLEHFISVEDPEQDLIVGFCRLRFPGDPVRSELIDAAVVRELHVYGHEVGIGNEGAWQHRGFGQQLMGRAEGIAADAGYDSLAVISGIGAREYYRRKLDYERDGPYMSKPL